MCAHRWPDTRSAAHRRIDESRNAHVADGNAIVDDFAPYALRVYRAMD